MASRRVSSSLGPVAVAATLALAVAGAPGAATGSPAPDDEHYGFQGETGRLADTDARGWTQPTEAQRSAAHELGDTVRWNRFGTPHVLTDHGGPLATGLEGEPETAARRWIADNRDLFGISGTAVADLELVRAAPLVDDPRDLHDGDPALAHAVTLRQTFDGLPATNDGLVTLGLSEDRLVWVSSSLTRGDRLNATTPQVDVTAALTAALRDVGRATGQLRETAGEDDWRVFELDGVEQVQRARLMALPTPDGVRLAWETLLIDNGSGERHPAAFTHFVDAVDGSIWLRRNRLDHFQQEDDPVATWQVFPAYPLPVPADGEVHGYASEDIRELWCWAPAPDCARAVSETGSVFAEDEAASPDPWDVLPPLGAPTFTTRGNNADAAPSALSPFTPDVATALRPRSPERRYEYEWTNQWYEERCNPDVFVSPERNDIEAATVNLFIGHNLMHDWGYYLGFTEENFNMQYHNYGRGGRENDPEMGDAQAGYLTGSANPIAGRDNANQITPPDGIPTITNQYLWQPIANAIYVACVDGDYDGSVYGHEYTHAITNRMTAGPDEGLSGHQAGSMGESWSDLVAQEFLNEYGVVPVADEHPWAVGPYVTSSWVRGVRNYNMTMSPLNYSNVGHDFIGPQVHSDGEIWSATQYQMREAFVDHYEATHPSGDEQLQRACAEGHRPVSECPGNRRWVQVMFDSYLLQPGQASMLDARDAMLAADEMRFDGAHHDLMWEVFAQRGFGEDAASPEFEGTNMAGLPGTQPGTDNTNPAPSFASPNHDNVSVTFAPLDVDTGESLDGVRVYVGQYEARAQPVADTDPETETGDTADLVAGTYRFVAVADGFGFHRFEETLEAGERTLRIPMQQNLASVHAGAEIDGDGRNLESLVDDTEVTNWASLESEGTDSEPNSVEGRTATVTLAGDGAHLVDRVQVSAMLRPTPGMDPLGNCEDDDEEDCNAQNRFSALRAFEIQVCNADAGDDCANDAGFTTVFTSPHDAFDGGELRPRVNDLTLREFDVDDTAATHVRFRVLTNQCTGEPTYQGELDDDPTNETDCVEGQGAGGLVPPQGENVRAAELQVFAAPDAPAADGPPQAPQPEPAPALPTTGGGAAFAALLLVAAGAALLFRRRS